MTRLRTVAVATALAAASVLATAAPGVAGSDARTTRAFTWQPTGGNVTGTLASNAADASPHGFVDYLDPTRTDVAWGTPVGAGEQATVTVGGTAYACATDRTLYYSGLTVLGNRANWAQLAPGSSVNGRVRLNCTVNGVVHHFHWGEHQLSSGKWSASPPTPNCVTISRTQEGFTVSATGCDVQHEIVSAKPGKQLSSTFVTADFTATLVLGAVLPNR